MRIPALLLVLAGAAGAQTITFSDGEFPSWTSSVVWTNGASTGGGTADVGGGNPGASWRVDHSVDTLGGVIVAHRPTDPAGSFDPVVQGPFERVEVSFEANVIDAAVFGSVVAFGVVAWQDGHFFYAKCNYQLVFTGDGWKLVGGDLAGPEFSEDGGGPAFLDFHGGGPITFGFYTSNSTGHAGGVALLHVDNFEATVHVGEGLLGTPYCQPTTANSIGSFSTLLALGSDTAADDDLTLRANCLPPNQFGYFLVSKTQASIPNPGGADGTLCLGGAIGRFNAQVQNSGAEGEFAIVVDTLALPMPSGSQAIQPGETWNFQAWYRDNNPGPTSNFTSATTILFD
ncbi:MAG: hypothetical protein O2816_14565 [Planctomycetota bacterium]|nr:hypothetical protein [Planctomycetota bacterium]